MSSQRVVVRRIAFCVVPLRGPMRPCWAEQAGSPAADGSWEVIGFYDPVRKASCSGAGFDVASDACVPTWVEPASTFGDSSCTGAPVAVAAPDGCSGPQPAAILEFGDPGDAGNACGSTKSIKTLWAVEAGRSAQVYDYDAAGNSCTRSVLGRVMTYRRGAVIDVASLPKVQVMQVGTGLLRMPFYAFAGMPLFPAPAPPPGPFTEAASGDSCMPYAFADGTWRCVPSTFPRVADWDLFYPKGDCTGERVYPWAATPCSGAREPAGMIVQLFGCGTAVTETLAFDGTISSPTEVFHPTPTVACQDFGTYPRSNVMLFKATKVVDPAERFIPFERKLSD